MLGLGDDCMNVGSPIEGALQPQIALEVQTSVKKMAMDSSKQQSDAMTQMMNHETQLMERSVNPHLGGSIDVKT